MHCHETSLETLGPVQAGHACLCRFRVAFRDGKRVDINERTSASSICGVVGNLRAKKVTAYLPLVFYTAKKKHHHTHIKALDTFDLDHKKWPELAADRLAWRAMLHSG